MKKYLFYITTFITLTAFQSNAQNHQSLKKDSQIKAKKILIVTTSFEAVKSTGKKTGLWLEEFTTPYYLLSESGIVLTIATPKGGIVPIDPKSVLPEYSTNSVKRFLGDTAAQYKLKNAIALKDINAKDYDAIFYPGGHGPMWDLPENTESIALIRAFYLQGKPVALVCHGPAALKNIYDKNGSPLIKGKRVSGFTDSEEINGNSVDMVPFSLESMLKQKGANYVKGPDWHPFVVQDGQLITGQNPASAEPLAKLVISELMKR